MKKALKISFISSILFYVAVNSLIFLKIGYDRNELNKYDLNNNGFFEEQESTSEQIIAFKKFSNDTGSSLAPLTLIPVSIIFGTILFIFYIFYQKVKKRNLTLKKSICIH